MDGDASTGGSGVPAASRDHIPSATPAPHDRIGAEPREGMDTAGKSAMCLREGIPQHHAYGPVALCPRILTCKRTRYAGRDYDRLSKSRVPCRGGNRWAGVERTPRTASIPALLSTSA